jgi:HNH endonuclease
MQDVVPKGLATAPTGPELCSLLASVEHDAVPDEQLLDVLSAHVRQLAYQQAQTWAVLAEVGRRDPMANVPGAPAWTEEQIFDSAVDEVRAELLLTRRGARREMERADAVTAAPRVFAELLAGRIDRSRALVLAEGCWDLTPEQTGVLLDELLPNAARYTATELAAKVQRIAIALDPAWAERRYRDAIRDRKVVGYLNPDGSATVSGQNLPADQAALACARVDALAHAAKRAGAVAKIDHLRSEVYLGLLDGRLHGLTPAAITAELLRLYPKPADPADNPLDQRPAASVAPRDAVEHQGVQVRVGLATLLGMDEQPGEVPGWGPVTAEVARSIAGAQRAGEWRFAIVDEDGLLLLDGITARRPRIDAGAAGAPDADASARRVRGGIVELHVPLSLLLEPALAGLRAEYPEWAGVLADLARQWAEQRPIEQDPAARFPGRPLRRRIQTTFQRCVFPGCRRPAVDCDADHRLEHSRGGRTDEENIAPPCRHDHNLKTTGGWRLIRRDARTFVWISPLGRRHVVHIAAVAPPLPAPLPRELPRVSLMSDDHDEPAPTFQPRDRRGRPLESMATGVRVATGPGARAVESTADPPPF